MMTKLKPKREFPLREKRLDKSVEMVTELSLLHQLNPAPVKTERMGKWYEVVIPIGKDHVAYLTMPEDIKHKEVFHNLRQELGDAVEWEVV